MEMVLETVEVTGFNLWFEQIDCRCSHEIVHWRFWTLQNNLDLLTLLIELNLLSWINCIVLEVEDRVLERRDWRTCVEVNWSLQDTIMHNPCLGFIKQIEVGCHPIVLDELTRSLVQSVQEVFRVIVVKIALDMIMGASRHATYKR